MVGQGLRGAPGELVVSEPIFAIGSIFLLSFEFDSFHKENPLNSMTLTAIQEMGSSSQLSFTGQLKVNLLLPGLLKFFLMCVSFSPALLSAVAGV